MSHHNHHHHHHHEERYEEAPYGYAPPPPAYGYGQESGYEIQPSYGYPPAVPNVGQSSYGNGGYGTYENSPYQDGYGAPAIYQEEQRVQQYEYLQREEHKHKNREHTAEMGVLAAGAFAMYEKHEEKVDPAHARQHKVEAEVAEAAALGLGGYALYEHHESNKYRKAEEEYNGPEGRHHKKHSWF